MAIEPVRRARLFLHCRPSRDDAQIAIDLHGIGVDDDAAALLRQFERQGRLAAGGRPCDKHGLAQIQRIRLHVPRRHPDLQPGQSRARHHHRRRRAGRSALARSGAVAVRRGRSRHSLRLSGQEPGRHQGDRNPPASGARRPADRHCRAACRGTAQEAFSGGHGFHHDRPGMHRRAGRFRRAEGACRRDHRTGDARRNRIRAGAARARCAVEGSAGQRGRRGAGETHHADAGRPRTGHDHARQRRLHLPDLGRLHAVHRCGRRHDRLPGKPRQPA